MKNFLKIFLPFEKFEFTTQMPKSEILKTVETIPDNINEDYIAKTYDDGFYVAEKAYKGGLLGTRNSFVPVGKAKICEKDDTCTVSVSIRMHIYVRIFCCIYLLISSLFFLFGSIGIISSFITAFSDGELLKTSVICLCFLPLFLLLENSAFRRPAKRMKELLTSCLFSEPPNTDLQ